MTQDRGFFQGSTNSFCNLFATEKMKFVYLETDNGMSSTTRFVHIGRCYGSVHETGRHTLFNVLVVLFVDRECLKF